MHTLSFDWDKQRFDLAMSARAQDYFLCSPDYEQCVTILFAAAILTALVRAKLVVINDKKKQLEGTPASSQRSFEAYLSSEDYIHEAMLPEDIMRDIDPEFFNSDQSQSKTTPVRNALIRRPLSKM